MIRLTKAEKVFNPGTVSELIAIDNIDLEISRGEYVILIGANGSGKSTLLNSIAGNVRLDSGEIFIDGLNVTSWQDYRRSKFISRIFQNPLSGTAPDLSIIDNFRLAALRSHSKNLHRGIDASFREEVKNKISFLEMGLENKLDQAMGLLSGGQRQALTLMMAVMDDTKVLLMDEPTAALDPKSSKIVIEKAKQLVEEYKLTALLVTHEIKFAHLYGSRVIQMSEGRIIRDIQAEEKRALVPANLYEWFA